MKQNFADAAHLGVAKTSLPETRDRLQRNWRNGVDLPSKGSVEQNIFAALFGDSEELADWKRDLQEALDAERAAKRANPHKTSTSTEAIAGAGPRWTDQSLLIVRDLIDDLWNLEERRLKKVLARNVGELGFWRNEMLRHIERISSGVGTAQDIDQISEIFDRTSGDIAVALQLLTNARTQLLYTVGGFDAAQKIDEIIYGSSHKEGIRGKIAEIVRCREFDTPEAKLMAKTAFDEIVLFNSRLSSLHQMLLLP